MNCRKLVSFTLTIILLTVLTLNAQTSNYLSQKLELEQALQNKISQAVERILGNSHFIVDVKADLDFVPDHRVEEVYEPAAPVRDDTRRTSPAQTPSAAAPAYEEEFDEILPGIPARIGDRRLDVLTEELPDESIRVREEQTALLPGIDSPESQDRLRSRSVARSTPLIPKVKRLDISIILKEGIKPDLVESIRQVAIVASHFDRVRGDVLSIMTTTFSEDETPKVDPVIAARDVRYERSQEEIQRTDDTQRLIQQIQDQINNLARQQEIRQTARSAEPTPTENMLLKIIDKLNTRQSIADDLETQKMITEQKIRLEMLGKDTTRLQELQNEIAALKLQLATQQMEVDDQLRTQAVSDSKYQEKRELEEAIAEKLALLSETQDELLSLQKSKIPLWFWAILVVLTAAIISLAVAIIRKGKKHENEMITREKNRQAEEESIRRKILSEIQAEKKESKLEREPVSPPDPIEKKAELDGIRKNIVNMSVANPDAASRIIRDWMEEETPADETAEEGERENE